MIKLIRTDSSDKGFQNLVIDLDKDLKEKNGEANDFFAQFNKIDLIKNTVVAYDDILPVGCGAMKRYDEATMEIKRMFVPIENRGKGIAGSILVELENWARELGYKKFVLETGDKMQEAIGLYKKSGYEIIANYGQYLGLETSICFEKKL